MKKDYLPGYFTIIFWIFISCNNEIDLIKDTSHLESEAEATLHIKLNSNIAYPADHLPGESDIRSVAFHIFNVADNTRDKKTPYVYLKEESKEFTVSVTPGEKRIYVTVNNSSNTVNESSLSALLYTIFVRPIKNPLGSAEIIGGIHSEWDGIPMAGKEEYISVQPGEIKEVTISVQRMISRINPPTAHGTLVSLSNEEKKRLKEETGKEFGNNLTFNLNSHIVINGGRSYMLYPDYGVEDEFERWTRWIRLPSYIKSVYDENGQLISTYSGNSFLENNEHVYVYENSPKLVSETELESSEKIYDASGIYAYIIQGELIDENGTSAIRYWRINIAKDAYHEGKKVAPYQILRNAIYKVNILNVKTAGYETPEEAEKELPYIPMEGESTIVVEIEINRWKVYNSVTDL